QTVSHARLLIRQVITDDHFQFRDDLPIELTRVIKRAAEQGHLKEQLEGNESRGQVDDLRTPITQVLTNQIEIAPEPAIGSPQTPIDAAVLERAKDSTRESRYGE